MAEIGGVLWKRQLQSGRLERVPLANKSAELLVEALEYVVEFVTPRELYSVMFCSKITKDAMSTSVIVKNALCNGNSYAKKSIENLLELMSQGSIYPPTNQRLVRMINVKRCEFCNVHRVNHIRVHFGVSICQRCLTLNSMTTLQITKPPQHRYRNIELNDVLRHKRVASCFHGWHVKSAPRAWLGPTRNGRTKYPHGERFYVWNHLTRDATGNAIGPIVTVKDVHQMVSFNRPDDIDSYINDVLKAPPLCDELYIDFSDAARQYRKIAFEATNRRRLERTAKTKSFRKRKLNKVQALITKLTEELPEEMHHLLRYDTNSRYLYYPYHANMSIPGYHRLCVHFNNLRVGRLMRQYVLAPTMLGTKQKRNQVVQKLKGIHENQQHHGRTAHFWLDDP